MKKFDFKNVKIEINRLLKLEQNLVGDKCVKDLTRIISLKRKKAYIKILKIIKDNIKEYPEEFCSWELDDDMRDVIYHPDYQASNFYTTFMKSELCYCPFCGRRIK